MVQPTVHLRTVEKRVCIGGDGGGDGCDDDDGGDGDDDDDGDGGDDDGDGGDGDDDDENNCFG